MYILHSKKGKPSLSLLRYGLHMVTHFQRRQNGRRKKGNFMVGKFDKYK